MRTLAPGAVAAAIAAAVLWLGPPGSDLAAHVYGVWFFRRHGFALWDNYWYSGRYVFATYSWLAYPLAALVGIKLLLTLSIGVAATAFARLVRYEPAVWAFAVVWGLYALSAALPFTLGTAFALVALNVWFPLFAALTWAASPLALLFLLMVAAGLRRWRAAAWTLPFAALQVALLLRYPNAGEFPFPGREALAAAVFCLGGIVFARARLRGVFVAWLALVALAVVFPSLLGENAARLRFVALPLALLALRGRPARLAVPVAALAAAYNLSPLYGSFRKGLDERGEHAAYWQPAVDWLRAHNSSSFRVNALDTVGHWEAVYLPRAGIPITRGWYRQDDFPQNALLYHPLDRASYLRWLHGQGVRFVVVPRDRLDYSSTAEPALAHTLRFRAHAGQTTIYEVPDATSIAPGAVVLQLRHDSITLQVAGATTTGRLAIRDDDGDWRRYRGRGTFTIRFP